MKRIIKKTIVLEVETDMTHRELARSIRAYGRIFRPAVSESPSYLRVLDIAINKDLEQYIQGLKASPKPNLDLTPETKEPSDAH